MNEILKQPVLETPQSERGKWMALTAALLGWMFDGFEMGLFPLAGRPALRTLLTVPDAPPPTDAAIGLWFGVSMAVFLIGAATGGVVFGWLGDRLGRVRSMMLSVLTYSLFTGLGAASQEVWHLVVLRFIAAMGMGGEWSLGVALVNEIWPGKSRAFLAGLIGAAANVGFLLIAYVNTFVPQEPESWRTLMLICAVPALLTFFIRIFVPESTRWERERGKGATAHWATVDLIGVLIGAAGACFIIVLWAMELHMAIRLPGSLLGLVIATLGFLYPVKRYLERTAIAEGSVGSSAQSWKPTIMLMLIGAGLSGVALLGTWGSLQWAPSWVDRLVELGQDDGITAYPKEWTQIVLAIGAIIGTILAALSGDWLGRRLTYFLLCIGSLFSIWGLYQLNDRFGVPLLIWAFLAGGITASFYGWLPLYLPELFRTRVRATGQGFSFNFGRIIAAIGALQTGVLVNQVFENSYPKAASVMGLIYVVGLVIIWLAPETKGKPLPE